MERVENVDSVGGTERRLASVSIPVRRPSPGALLQFGKGCPRGFWAREGRWFAHIGRASEILLSTTDPTPSRFESVWKEARRLASCVWRDPSSEVQPPPPRLFGGFAFGDDPPLTDAWEGFPPARFVLPKAELMGTGESGILTLRKLLEPGEDPRECRGELECYLRRLEEALRSAGGVEDGGGAWIPATRGETDRSDWDEAVRRILARIDSGPIEKVVLARVLAVTPQEGLTPTGVAMALWGGNPGAHVFLFEPSPGRALVGAAPETLATVTGGHFRATAVAGSAPRGTSQADREALARGLMQSEKDRREHDVSVRDMVDRLAPLSEEVRPEPHPHVIALPAIQHLETVIEANLRPGETVLSVLEALHPTPAVCGYPRGSALEVIAVEEPFDRGWYAGPVGWFDGDGNGVFVPALRSAVFQDPEWRLFAGAGVVAGSDPVQEWEETRIKFLPMLRALAEAEGAQDEPRGLADLCDEALADFLREGEVT